MENLERPSYVETREDTTHPIAHIGKGNRNGRMLTLDARILEMSAAIFAHGKGVVIDIDIWHKHTSHVNIERLKKMQVENIVCRVSKLNGG